MNPTAATKASPPQPPGDASLSKEDYEDLERLYEKGLLQPSDL